jgi:hypothetical protein
MPISSRFCLVAFALLALAHPGEVQASRNVYSTFLSQRVDGGPSQTVKGSATRITVMLRNVSPVAQVGKVRLSGINRMEEVVFDTAANIGPLSAWTVGLPNMVSRRYGLADQEKAFTLDPCTVDSISQRCNNPPGSYTAVGFNIGCVFTNNTTSSDCNPTSEGAVAAASCLANTIGGTLTTGAGIDVYVRDDRGAVLADFTIQDLVAGCTTNVSASLLRPLNGGRPF